MGKKDSHYPTIIGNRTIQKIIGQSYIAIILIVGKLKHILPLQQMICYIADKVTCTKLQAYQFHQKYTVHFQNIVPDIFVTLRSI